MVNNGTISVNSNLEKNRNSGKSRTMKPVYLHHWFLTGVPRAFCKCFAKL